ncbi:MAG: TnpV protein [Oscillospiraceae bacterium]|nr:TnpV protein [Oscillospiraceae bacterium]
MTENGIHYILDEKTQTYIPDFQDKEPEKIHIGKFGRMREKYLQEHYGATYSKMLMKNELIPHLISVEEQAMIMEEQIMEELAEADGTNEELKATDQMKWVGLMNNYRQTAQEIIRKELIERMP